MASYICPFCEVSIPLTIDTQFTIEYGFKQLINPYNRSSRNIDTENLLSISFIKCPECKKVIILATGTGGDIKDEVFHIYPRSLAKKYSDYIPEQIRQDYEEACAIVNLSPKASATLSRRCLQGMIRDFWEVKKDSLYNEINAIESLVSPSHKKVLHSLRQIGNIGAHPESDVNTIIDIEPGDAQKLIKVIELFMQDWYIARHEAECLINDVIDLNDNLQKQRNNND